MRWKAAVLIWIVRLGFSLGSMSFLAVFWKYRRSDFWLGHTIVLSMTAICLASLGISFIRARIALRVITCVVVLIPLVFWVTLNSSLKGGLWSWLIAFPAQMAVPVWTAYLLWQSRAVADYYKSHPDGSCERNSALKQ